MERLICLAVGYVFGLFQTGYIYGRLNGIDIRQYGSGNSGTTNALRVLGKKAGLIVFAGDFFKTLIPCLAVRLLLKDHGNTGYLYLLYTGLGVILGHNFPCYLKFKGGKGIAATAGLIAAMDLRVGIICLAAFVAVVAATRYVSLGSLIISAIFFVWNVAMAKSYGVPASSLAEFDILAGIICVMAFWRHRANIGRLLHGTENKLWGGKKGAAQGDKKPAEAGKQR